MKESDLVSRRALLASATALLPAGALARDAAVGNGGKPDAVPVRRSNPKAVNLAGPALLEAFMKMSATTDGRIAIGWIDAVTYAFIEGETFPLYRLFAATWYQFKAASPDRFEGTSLEVAFFHDIDTGEPLKTLTMPRTGSVADVPLYRAGPSPGQVMLRREERREFGMARETRQGESFFRPGIALSRQWLSEVQRDGDSLLVREDIDTRVTPGDPAAPGFFYREWTVRRSPWDVVMDPRRTSAPVEVLYTGLAAFRPWMKMGATPGHTVQNGQGGKVERAEDLPDTVLALCRQHHPDLVNEPDKALRLKPKTG